MCIMFCRAFCACLERGADEEEAHQAALAAERGPAEGVPVAADVQAPVVGEKIDR